MEYGKTATAASFLAWREKIRQGRTEILRKLVEQYGEEEYEQELVLRLLRNNFKR